MKIGQLWSKIQHRVESEVCRRSYRKQIEFELDHPIVTFTFDDFPATALHTAGKMLEQCEMQGTYYTALGLEGITNELGKHFSRDDLHQLREYGHELACHTYSHHTCRELPPAQYVQDIERNSAEFANEFPDLSLDVFSYPKGVIKPLHHQPVSKRFRCLRTVTPGINRKTINLNYVLAIQLYDRAIDADKVNRLINELEEEPGWLVFYTHDVRDNPSQYGVSPGLFESTVRRVGQSNAKVMTVSAAIDSMVTPV